MREVGGKEYFEALMAAFDEYKDEHIAVYGPDNHLRLTGLHETQSIDKFNYGVADRGASIRVPHSFVNNGYKGYLEDRRPNSQGDPYQDRRPDPADDPARARARGARERERRRPHVGLRPRRGGRAADPVAVTTRRPPGASSAGWAAVVSIPRQMCAFPVRLTAERGMLRLPQSPRPEPRHRQWHEDQNSTSSAARCAARVGVPPQESVG